MGRSLIVFLLKEGYALGHAWERSERRIASHRKSQTILGTTSGLVSFAQHQWTWLFRRTAKQFLVDLAVQVDRQKDSSVT